MTTSVFFDLFLKELNMNQHLLPYYQLNRGSAAQQEFRKAYFLQRLEFIEKHIGKDQNISVLDCGCGFGTTAFFLGLNHIHVIGTTLEYYFDQIDNRKNYWSNFGNTETITFKYQNIFDSSFEENYFDYIILQDTLHHIEPVSEALQIFYKLIKKGGKLLLVEENGACWVRNAILFAKRGNNRITEYYDPKLNKTMLFGNENIRSENDWIHLFKKAGFENEKQDTTFVRYFFPIAYKFCSTEKIIQKEQKIALKNDRIRNHCFFGMNMVFSKI